MAINGSIVVAIEGAFDSGKTTLACSAVGRLRAEGIDAELVPESARSSPFFQAAQMYGGPAITESAELHILGEQIAAEQLCAARSPVLVADRALINVPSYWNIRFRDRDDEAEAFFGAMRTFVIAYCRQTYDCIFLLADYFGEQADRFVEQGADFQTAVARQMRQDLSELEEKLVLVPRGLTYEHRTGFVTATIRRIVASTGVIPDSIGLGDSDER